MQNPPRGQDTLLRSSFAVAFALGATRHGDFIVADASATNGDAITAQAMVHATAITDTRRICLPPWNDPLAALNVDLAYNMTHLSMGIFGRPSLPHAGGPPHVRPRPLRA